MTPDERLARLETLYADLREDVNQITTTIEGPPGNRNESIRGRLHKLETDEIAAQAAQAALATVRELRDRRLTTTEKRAAIFFGAVLALGSVITSVLLVVQFIQHHP